MCVCVDRVFECAPVVFGRCVLCVGVGVSVLGFGVFWCVFGCVFVC